MIEDQKLSEFQEKSRVQFLHYISRGRKRQGADPDDGGIRQEVDL